VRDEAEQVMGTFQQARLGIAHAMLLDQPRKIADGTQLRLIAVGDRLTIAQAHRSGAEVVGFVAHESVHDVAVLAHHRAQVIGEPALYLRS
jgi:hypothetical protein